jgi:NAD(P)-dependent dehydrogenase (short-subunit alcohol dehydrogenase family)
VAVRATQLITACPGVDYLPAYSDSKLPITTFAFAVARLWPRVCSNAVDPG